MLAPERVHDPDPALAGESAVAESLAVRGSQIPSWRHGRVGVYMKILI